METQQIKMQCGEQDSDIAGRFFHTVYNDLSKLKPTPYPQIVVRDCVQSNDRLSMLISDNKMIALVVERRTEFNDLEFTLIKV